jgi:hypothetical protein
VQLDTGGCIDHNHRAANPSLTNRIIEHAVRAKAQPLEPR